MRRQHGQSLTDWMVIVAGVALFSMVGFSVMNAGVGSQSAAMADALAGGAPKPVVQFNTAVQSSGIALVDFDAAPAAAAPPSTQADASSGTIAFGQGFVAGLIDNLWQELSALLNPVDTALAMAELLRLLATEPAETLQLLYDELIASQIDKFVNGNDYERGFVIGNQVSALKAVSVLAKASGAAVLVGIAKKSDDADPIPRINGNRPKNYTWANDTHPSGVKFNERGFPDFSPYAKAEVKLDGLTGDYYHDSKLANKAVDLKKTPEGWTWHHVEDGRTMQLIPTDIHNAARHTGGRAVLKHIRNHGAPP